MASTPRSGLGSSAPPVGVEWWIIVVELYVRYVQYVQIALYLKSKVIRGTKWPSTDTIVIWKTNKRFAKS